MDFISNAQQNSILSTTYINTTDITIPATAITADVTIPATATIAFSDGSNGCYNTAHGVIGSDRYGGNDNMAISQKNDTKECVPEDVKCVLTENEKSHWMELRVNENGRLGSPKRVIPAIVDVKPIMDKNDGDLRCVRVYFADDTYTSATLDNMEPVVGTVESGIGICIAKKLFNVVLNGDYGGPTYNKLVRRATKLVEKKEQDAKRQEEAKAEDARRKANREAKKVRRKERLRQREREEKIDIHKEAILRALREHNSLCDDLK